MDFGSTVSSQIRSSSNDAGFWFTDKLTNGEKPCLIVGKYPRTFYNLNMFEDDQILDFVFQV